MNEDLLHRLIEYFEDLSDADGDINGGFIPNEEMIFLNELEALQAETTPKEIPNFEGTLEALNDLTIK